MLQREGWTPDSVGRKLFGKLELRKDPLYNLDPSQDGLDTAPQLRKQLKREANLARIAHRKHPSSFIWFIGDIEVSKLVVCPWHQVPGIELEFEVAPRPRIATKVEEQAEEEQDGEHFAAVAGSSSSAVAGKRSRSRTPTTTVYANTGPRTEELVYVDTIYTPLSRGSLIHAPWRANAASRSRSRGERN